MSTGSLPYKCSFTSLNYLQISMNVPALKLTSVVPTLSVATLKDRLHVAAMQDIQEMEKRAQVIADFLSCQCKEFPIKEVNKNSEEIRDAAQDCDG